MWITNDNDSTRRQYNAAVFDDLVDDPVADLPGDAPGIVWDGPVQVTDAVGEALVEHYDTIRPYEADE